MFRYALLCLAAIGLSGCMATAGPSFNGPTGEAINTAKCSKSTVGCLQTASQVCGGPYAIIGNESHPGGVLADVIPGPVTWYVMAYRCAPSNGKMPTIASRGVSRGAPGERCNQPAGGSALRQLAEDDTEAAEQVGAERRSVRARPQCE
jgi:hypothetical protein